MSENVFNLRQYKLQQAIDMYRSSGILSNELTNGNIIISGSDFNTYSNNTDDIVILQRLAVLQEEFLSNNEQIIRHSIDQKFKQVYAKNKTENPFFKIPSLEYKYRAGMNPIRALYYEAGLEDKKRKGTLCCESNTWWGCGLMADNIYYNELHKSLKHDIELFNSFILWYEKLCRDRGIGLKPVPLSVIHSSRKIQDMTIELEFFEMLRSRIINANDPR